MAGLTDARAVAGGGYLGTVGIEAASRAVGVSPSAIRLWERQGLVAPARTPGGTRRYSAADIARLHAVRRMRAVDGLNAAAIRRLLHDAGEGSQARVHERPEAPYARLGPATSPGPAPVRPAGAPEGSDASVARRLRTMRQAGGLTLAAAAERSGLSISFISALERSLSGASVAALRRLLAAYGATLADLLGSPAGKPSRLVPAAGRQVLETGAGVRIENLAEAPGALESQLFVLAPGASSQGTYAHAGEEFMYVLSGSLSVWIDETEEYLLAAGDALTFPSSLAHRFQALGPTETRLLWINTPPTF